MLEFTTIAIVSATFVLAGIVKGVIGMGLPTVSLAILTLAIDLPTAMALLLAPSLITNIWQGVIGGQFRQLSEKLWPFLLPAMLTVWCGVSLGKTVDVTLLSTILGILLVGYGIFGLFGSSLISSLPPVLSRTVNPVPAALMGGLNGIFTGLTGSFVVPGVMYLQSLRLPRDQLIQSMGILFSVSTLALGIALTGEERITSATAWLSVAAIVPAILGMILGQRLRTFVSERLYRRLFFLAVLLMGMVIILIAISPK